MAPSLETELRGLLPSSLLPLWRRRGLETLLPLQRRAIHETGLFGGRHLLVLAPSSSGKTMIAEQAVARALASGRRALFLSPTRALAEQQFAAFNSGFAGAGLNVVCSTSDRPESDAAVAAGRFDVLVAVYEKLRGFLATDSRLLAGVGAVAIDEIQMLADPERGPRLDLLVTQLLRCPYAPQLVALGPPLEDPGPLARWLGAEVLQSQARPRVLREGVLVGCSGRFHYRRAGDEASPTSFDAAPDESWAPTARLEFLERTILEAAEAHSIPCGEDVPPLLAAAVHAASTRGPAILFAPTRRCSRRWAGLVAALDAGFSPARVALAELEQSSAAGRLRHTLHEALAAGVAFHNADLGPDLRALVESAFESGEVRLLISTPTLGIGVNLCARTVLHTPWRLGSPLELAARRGSPTGRPACESRVVTSVAMPLDPARFAQQGGRAGRLGRGDTAGNSVLVARSPDEARRLWDRLVAAPPGNLALPPLGFISLEECVLGLLAGGARRTSVNVAGEFESTFSGHLQPAPWTAPGERRVEGVLQDLERRGFVRRGEDGLWGPSGLGETAVRASLPPATLEALQRAVEMDLPEPFPCPLRECSFLYRLALTTEGVMACGGLPFARRRPPLPLPEGAETAEAEPSLPFGSTPREGGFASREIQAWCAASALGDWSRGLDTVALEEKYDVEAGSVAGAAEGLGRLALAAAGLSRVFDSGEDVVGRLGELAERLIHGVDAPGLGLARLRVPGLSRDAVMRLVVEGHTEPVAIGRVPLEKLEAVAGPDTASRLRSACAVMPSFSAPGADVPTPRRHPALRKPASPPSESGDNGPYRSRCATMPLLEINLQSPGIVQAAGREVRLPPLGFDLLVALAERPGEVVTRDALYHRLWPEAGPEDQQLDAHRRRLIARLRPALGAQAASAAEVVRGIGFRLAFDAARVRIHRGSSFRSKSGCAPQLSTG